MEFDEARLVRDAEALRSLYGPPLERSLRKQMDRLDSHCRAFIARSPFLLLATATTEGIDCSPRGDKPGFVQVADDTTLLIPDRRGNNRVDSLLNIVANPVVGMLFLIPGIAETLRVNGTALLSCDPSLTARFAVDGKEPKTILIVETKEVYVQCSRALVRSDIWNPETFAERCSVPSMGTMLAAHTRGFVDAQAFDEEARTRVPVTLY
jgi:PPOX class probable FMN-dependent enzyme